GGRTHAGRPGPAGRRGRRLSQQVTRTSDALDLERDVFKLRNPRAVAASLRRSALRSKRRKAPAFQSAMSMLTFYITRAGGGPPGGKTRALDRARTDRRGSCGGGTAGPGEGSGRPRSS